MGDQNFLSDLNTEDAADGNNPRVLLNRLRAIDHFLDTISTRLTTTNDALNHGPPIEPESAAVVQSIQDLAASIVTLSDTILARNTPTS